jgi:hypothetical protein
LLDAVRRHRSAYYALTVLALSFTSTSHQGSRCQNQTLLGLFYFVDSSSVVRGASSCKSLGNVTLMDRCDVSQNLSGSRSSHQCKHVMRIYEHVMLLKWI